MYLRLILVAVVLGTTGWLHGRWTDRWGGDGSVDAAAATLPSVPLTFGDWEGRDITRKESEVVYRSQSPQIVRRYVNRTTGAAIGLLVSCGRPSGMIIEHTPRACYKELGFEELGTGEKVKAGGGEFQSHLFVKSSAVTTSRVRLLWAWGDEHGWSSPNRPRVTFASKPFIFKMYVTRELLSDNEPLADDPTLAFLAAAMPKLTTLPVLAPSVSKPQ